MSAITNQWTGNGLPDGTEITADNVNTAGNGAEVTPAGLTGVGATMVTEGSGVRIAAPGSSLVRRLDAAISGTAVRLQCRLKVDVLPTGDATTFMQVRSASGAIRSFTVSLAGRIGVGGLANNTTAPAVKLSDLVLIDAVLTQASSPTASNGRVFFRVKNLSDPTWNETGEYFYDSGYTVDAGTVAFAQVRFGKMTTDTLPAPGNLYEFLGWETITVNPAHTSETQAIAYFADAPVFVPPPTDGDAKPISGNGTGDSGWTVFGSASTEGDALADASTSTGVESPDITSTATERIFRLAPMAARTALTLSLTGVSLTAAGTATCQVKVYSGATVVATKSLTATTTAATRTITLSSAEVAAITDWTNVRVGIRAVA